MNFTLRWVASLARSSILEIARPAIRAARSAQLIRCSLRRSSASLATPCSRSNRRLRQLRQVPQPIDAGRLHRPNHRVADVLEHRGAPRAVQAG